MTAQTNSVCLTMLRSALITQILPTTPRLPHLMDGLYLSKPCFFGRIPMLQREDFPVADGSTLCFTDRLAQLTGAGVFKPGKTITSNMKRCTYESTARQAAR